VQFKRRGGNSLTKVKYLQFPDVQTLEKYTVDAHPILLDQAPMRIAYMWNQPTRNRQDRTLTEAAYSPIELEPGGTVERQRIGPEPLAGVRR